MHDIRYTTMQQFTVPQFIDVEDKIIGPITVRQFVIMLICGGVMFLQYKLSDFILFIFLAVPTFIVFGTFAFLKVNGMPFHYFLINVIDTLKKPKVRVWNRELIALIRNKNAAKAVVAKPLAVKRPVTSSRISDISLILDTGGIYRGEGFGHEEFYQFKK